MARLISEGKGKKMDVGAKIELTVRQRICSTVRGVLSSFVRSSPIVTENVRRCEHFYYYKTGQTEYSVVGRCILDEHDDKIRHQLDYSGWGLGE